MSESKPRRGRKPRLSKDVIVAKALELLDDKGLPDLSMRRIGQALGAQPSALYWHFPDKQSLLAAVSAEVLGTPDADDASNASHDGWETAMRRSAAGLRAHLLSHRDGAELVSSSYALGLVELPLTRELAGPLAAAGATETATADIAGTLGHFILGHAFHEQQREAAREAGIEAGGDVDEDASFTAGVELIVAGTAVRLSIDAAGR